MHNVFYSLTFFLFAYLFCVPLNNAVESIQTNKNGVFYSGTASKGNEMRLADLSIVARNKILGHLREAEYQVSQCENTLSTGKVSRYRVINRNQNLIAHFTDQEVHLVPNGKTKRPWIGTLCEC